MELHSAIARHKYRLLALAVSAGSITTAHAAMLDPAPVKLGFIDLVPSLSLKEEYDSNFYRQASNPQEFWVQILGLQLQAIALDGPHEYALNYRAEAGFIDESSDDNYVDQLATLSGKWDADHRHRFELAGTYQQDHDRRGTEYFQGTQAQLIDEPFRFEQQSVLGRYSYGANKARGRLEVEVMGTDRSYLDVPDDAEQRDRSNVYGNVTFFWRIGGNTRALLEARHGTVDYKDDAFSQTGAGISRDSDYTTYLTGVTWELAGKTSGTLKVGHATKQFDDDSREDFAGTSWSGELAWRPATYSELTFATGRRADESNGRGDYIDATDAEVIWRHDWSDRIESRVRYLRSDETYEADPEGRDDTLYRYGFNVDYALRRWLVIGLYYAHDKRESTLAEFDYPRDLAGLQLQMAL